MHNFTTKNWQFRMWLLCCCGLNINNKFSQRGKKNQKQKKQKQTKKQKIIIVCYNNDLIACNSYIITIEDR